MEIKIKKEIEMTIKKGIGDSVIINFDDTRQSLTFYQRDDVELTYEKDFEQLTGLNIEEVSGKFKVKQLKEQANYAQDQLDKQIWLNSEEYKEWKLVSKEVIDHYNFSEEDVKDKSTKELKEILKGERYGKQIQGIKEYTK